jgi:DNA polymerase
MERTLDDVYKEINRCQKCPLHKHRIAEYWYRGNPDADIFLIGEGLGEQEQKQGRPFVGRTGQLLTKLLNEVGLTEDKIYISNMVKDRPPENRDPLAHEIEACKDFLIEELKLVRPKLIITVGKVSSLWFNHYKPFNWYEYKPERLWIPVYHPGYLIRQKQDKKDEWKNIILDTAKKAGAL